MNGVWGMRGGGLRRSRAVVSLSELADAGHREVEYEDL
jgi:hypothetical protein